MSNPAWRLFAAAAAVAVWAMGSVASPARAQQPPQAPAQAQAPAPAPGAPWSTGVEIRKTQPAPAPGKTNTTVIERDGKGGASGVKLVALLTVDGQQIDQGLIWRVFQAGENGKLKQLAEHRDASPALKLAPGDYVVNAAFGRANLTRKIQIKANAAATEQFVLNAGGLRVNALTSGKAAVPGAVSYSILSDDRDQSDSRASVMTGAKPNLIIRLNAGIYHVISTYGDANAHVETDVTVEAGKLTETTLAHTGGKATFRLVSRPGGEALPDVQWSVQTEGGEAVKDSVGALPTHILAPGKYTVAASSGGRLYRSNFEVKDGGTTTVEVVMDASAISAAPAAAAPAEAAPAAAVKNP